MLLGGVQGWFDAPVFARFVLNAVRIGADDVLTGIDTLMDWRWCSPTPSAGWGVPGSGLRVIIRCPLHVSADQAVAPQSWRTRPQLWLDLMLFCGLGLFAPAPDETIYC
ncbi:MAG: hypothetical protein GDA36_14155 [Rhodobacteraceae bacterium]|nr:hypothetical protein [Paracoccaceae bacterium]